MKIANPYKVECPYCKAPPKAKCRDHLGRSVTAHKRRREAAK